MPGTVSAVKLYLSLPRPEGGPDLFLLPARETTLRVSLVSYLARGCRPPASPNRPLLPLGRPLAPALPRPAPALTPFLWAATNSARPGGTGLDPHRRASGGKSSGGRRAGSSSRRTWRRGTRPPL